MNEEKGMSAMNIGVLRVAGTALVGLLALGCGFGGSSTSSGAGGAAGSSTGAGGAGVGAGGTVGTGTGSAASSGAAGASAGSTGTGGMVPTGGTSGVFSCRPGVEELIITDC